MLNPKSNSNTYIYVLDVTACILVKKRLKISLIHIKCHLIKMLLSTT